MMNILKRTIVILIAALVIVGILVGFSKSSIARSLNGRQQRNRPAAQVQSGTADASTSVQRPPMGEREGGGPGGMGIVAVLPDLLIIAVIVVPVQLGAMMIRRLKRREELKPL